eukprot:15448024-Alexandrium_andersonii.AAC.1
MLCWRPPHEGCRSLAGMRNRRAEPRGVARELPRATSSASSRRGLPALPRASGEPCWDGASPTK